MKYLLYLCVLGMLTSCRSNAGMVNKVGEEEIILTAFSKRVDPDAKNIRSGIPSEEVQPGVKGVYPEVKKGREGWKETRLYFKNTDFPQLLYQRYREGKVTRDVCMEYFNAWGMDTSQCSPLFARGYVALLEGRGEDGRLYLVADNNGNMDFSDDMPHLISQDAHPMPIVYERIIGEHILLDSSWILPGKLEVDKDFIFCENRDLMTTGFKLGGRDYVCNLRPNGDFYDTQQSEVEFIGPDTVIRCRLQEYVKLEGNLYRIDSIRRDGRYLRMCKEENSENIRSTQVGAFPLAFDAVTVDGDKIHFPDGLKGKYVLLDFWSTGCGPCIAEIRNTYPELYARYKEKGFEIVGVADNKKEEIIGFRTMTALPWPVIADREGERKIQKLYNINSFPTLFLLGPDGKIIDKGSELRDRSLAKRLKEIFEHTK